MLEPAPKEKDSYFRAVDIELSPVDNVEEGDRYELERLLDRRVTSRDSKDRRKKIVQYLVKWKG
jgi:hypothetical protein